jgi:Spy/CpxP family protein refolding chaperone
MKKTLILVALLVVVYLLGMMSGFLSVRHFPGGQRRGFMPPPPPPMDGRPDKAQEQRMVNRFAKDLDLTDQQKSQVIQIMTSNKTVIDNYRDEFNAKMKKQMDKMDENIKSILTLDQKTKFEKMHATRPGPGKHEFGKPDPEMSHNVPR